MPVRWSMATALAVLALLCALPVRALASSTEESMLMDDKGLIYSENPGQVGWTLEQAKTLGIDRLKISVVWSLVAPHPNSKHRPKFDAAKPNAYPSGAWSRWDKLDQEAKQLGLKVFFQIVPPAPKWALAKGPHPQGYNWSHDPSPAAYGKFVKAVARRYSGHFVPAKGQPPLPRVSYWGLWNEPDEGAWLNPQWRTVRHHNYYEAPAFYRRLLDAGYGALRATGHGRDTILIGETASHGWIYPLPFVQALYCVGTNDRPLRGSAATSIGCPASGSRSGFVKHNPGLFAAGYAHHPYSFDTPPNKVLSDPREITLANLGSLERTLNRIFNAYHRHHQGGVPMYLDEYGYKTNPPNPYVHTSLAQQAEWLNEGEYLSWKDAYVRTLDQFLLVDDRPASGTRVGSRAYWGTFQSGLYFVNDQPKPSYAAFRIPIWLPKPRHGPSVTIWGQLRPANHSGTQTGQIQFQRSGGSWSTLTTVQTTNPEGFLLTQVALASPGSVRLAFTDPNTGATDYSRTVTVS